MGDINMFTNVTVNDVITAIENGQATIKEISEHYNVSDRTVQNKIKSLGFTWNAKERKYNKENVMQDVYSLKFDEIMQSNIKTRDNSKKAVTKQIQQPSDISKDNNTNLELIDYLLFGDTKPKKEKKLRGFYLSDDILEVIDKAPPKNKSALVEECLRYVFKQKGLL